MFLQTMLPIQGLVWTLFTMFLLECFSDINRFSQNALDSQCVLLFRCGYVGQVVGSAHMFGLQLQEDSKGMQE